MRWDWHSGRYYVCVCVCVCVLLHSRQDWLAMRLRRGVAEKGARASFSNLLASTHPHGMLINMEGGGWNKRKV